MYIGIDFGTTCSMVSIYMSNENKVGLETGLFRDTEFPTLLRYDDMTGEWYYGEACRIDTYPIETIRNIKAEIRKGEGIDKKTKYSNGLTYRTMITNYLRWLIESALKKARKLLRFGAQEKVECITVTVPCGFTGSGMSGSGYRQAIKESTIAAYRQAINIGANLALGSDVPVKILEEPVAAALDYLDGDGRNDLDEKPEMNILVADLGGGTFDVTIVNCDGRDKFYVREKSGDLNLGGNDFDEKLLNFLLKKIKVNNPEFSLSPEDKKRDLIRAKDTKEWLSEMKCQTFNSCKGVRIGVTRQEFENATVDLLNRIKNIIKGVVDKNGGINTIDKIILVGGGCNMPQILNGIKKLYPDFNEQDIKIFSPSHSIANGAAIRSSMKDDFTVLSDIATMTYGINYVHVDCDANGNITNKTSMIQNVIFAGTEFNKEGKIVCAPGQTYVPLEPDQEKATFNVYESIFTKDNDTVKFDENRSKFNSKDLSVTYSIPEEYYSNKKASEYTVSARMTLTSDGILKLEILHDGEVVGSNQKQI